MNLHDLCALTAISTEGLYNAMDGIEFDPAYGVNVLLPAARGQLQWERMTYA